MGLQAGGVPGRVLQRLYAQVSVPRLAALLRRPSAPFPVFLARLHLPTHPLACNLPTKCQRFQSLRGGVKIPRGFCHSRWAQPTQRGGERAVLVLVPGPRGGFLELSKIYHTVFVTPLGKLNCFYPVM